MHDSNCRHANSVDAKHCAEYIRDHIFPSLQYHHSNNEYQLWTPSVGTTRTESCITIDIIWYQEAAICHKSEVSERKRWMIAVEWELCIDILGYLSQLWDLPCFSMVNPRHNAGGGIFRFNLRFLSTGMLVERNLWLIWKCQIPCMLSSLDWPLLVSYVMKMIPNLVESWLPQHNVHELSQLQHLYMVDPSIWTNPGVCIWMRSLVWMWRLPVI